MEYLPIITATISIISIIFCILTFAVNRNKDTKTDASNSSYKQGQIDEKLNHIFEKLSTIEKKLDLYDTELDERINKALDEHVKIYHKEK